MRRDYEGKAVLIKCPVTGSPLKTGLYMNRRSFKDQLIEQQEVRCTHCGKIHIWSKKDAHLAGETR